MGLLLIPGTPPRSTSSAVLVIVGDVDEFTPDFSIADHEISMLQNTPVNTTVLQVDAEDEDGGMCGVKR